jgi:hypothetical protein
LSTWRLQRRCRLRGRRARATLGMGGDGCFGPSFFCTWPGKNETADGQARTGTTVREEIRGSTHLSAFRARQFR